MKRLIDKYLINWKNELGRKSLLLRGARQVGKTWLARHFKDQNRVQVIELNFEKRPELKDLFTSNDVASIIESLEIGLNIDINLDWIRKSSARRSESTTCSIRGLALRDVFGSHGGVQAGRA